MFAAIGLFWQGLPKWARDALFLGALIIGGLFLGKAWVDAQRAEAARRERERQDRETAKEREVVLNTSHTVIKDIENAKDAAIAAPDTVPVVGGPDELRVKAPAVAKIILRDRG